MSGIKSIFGRVPLQAFAFGVFSIYLFYRLSLPVEGVYDIELTKDLGNPSGAMIQEVTDAHAFLSYGKHGVVAMNIQDKGNVFEAGSFDTFGTARGLALKDKKLFVADGVNGIVILDVSDPTNLVQLRHIPGINDARDVVIKGDYAYISDGKSGLYSLRVNPFPAEGESPQLRNNGDAGVGLTRILVQGNQIYTIGLDNNLYFFKIDGNRPDVAVKTSTIPIGTPIRDFKLWESHLFLVADGLGLAWIKNPSEATTEIGGNHSITGVINTLDVYGDFAFLGVSGSGIKAYDISNPEHIQLVSDGGDVEDDDVKQPTSLIYDVSYIAGESKSYIYVGDGRKGFKSLRVDYKAKGSDDDQGKVLGSVEDIAVFGDYIYVASCEQGIWVIETEDAEDGTKKKVAFYEIKELRGCPKAVDVDEDHLYLINVTESGSSISIYNRSVSNVTPEFLSDIGTPGTANDLVVSGEYIFVADGKQGLQIAQRGGIFNAVIAGLQFDDGDSRVADAQGIFLQDNVAYVAAGNEGLQIVNVSDPTIPSLYSSHEVGFFARAVYVQEHPFDNYRDRKLAYIVGGDDNTPSGLKIIDVTDPSRPQDVGNLLGSSEPLIDVVVEGSTAYLLEKNKGVMLFNIADPAAPWRIDYGEIVPADYSRLTLHDHIVYIGKREQGFEAIKFNESNEIVVVLKDSGRWVVADAVVVDRYVYIVDGARGLRIVDISDYRNPTMVRFYPTSGPSHGITIDRGRNRAYLANFNQGIEVIDISNLENPFQIGVFAELNAAVDVEFTEEYAYVATGDGLAVLDIRNLGEIKLVDLHKLEGSINDITVRGDYLFISKGHSGMVVLSIVNPQNPHEITVERTNLSNAMKAISSPYHDHLIVADGENGLNIFDVSNPAILHPIFDYENEEINKTTDVSVLGRYIVAADDTNGARIFYFPGEYYVPTWEDTVEIGSKGDLVKNAIAIDLTPGEPADFHVVISEGEGGLRVRRVEKGLQTTAISFEEAPGKANLFELLMGGSNPKRTQRDRLLFLGGIGGFALSTLVMLVILSGKILPIEAKGIQSDVLSLLSSYMLGGHGPVVFVNEGEHSVRDGPFNKVGPGFIKIDTCSAAVLEKTAFQPGLVGGLLKAIRGSHPRDNLGMRSVDWGVKFTHVGERVRGIADLRRQIRLKPGVKVHTRDGIEVNSVVFALFTLGEPPDVLRVAYEGHEQIPEKLRVFGTKLVPPEDNGESDFQVQVVSKMQDDLDSEDKLEIHQFVQSYRRRAGLSVEAGKKQPKRWRPFRFYPNRVFSAITLRPYDVYDEELKDWTEIPVHIAVNIFREHISQHLYDRLYDPKEHRTYPLADLKNSLRTRMVNMGILSYQYVERSDGEPLEINQELGEGDLILYPERELKTKKVLRSRGIKVITAGFTELTPSISDVQSHYMYDYWRAPWQQEATIVRADHELQAMRLKNQSRAQAQRDMAFTLSKILASTEYTQEAMALRVFQALEDLAADPDIKRLLPDNTINMIRGLRNLLLPGEASIF